MRAIDRSLLRLPWCPRCGHQVPPAPIPDRCAECGEALDRSMTIIEGAARRGETTRVFIALTVFLVAASVVAIVRHPQLIPCCAAPLVAAMIALAVRLLRTSRYPTSAEQLLYFDDSGICVFTEDRKIKPSRWTRFRKVRLVRPLELRSRSTPPLWRIEVHAFALKLEGAVFFAFRGSRAQASAVAAAIRRRLS